MNQDKLLEAVHHFFSKVEPKECNLQIAHQIPYPNLECRGNIEEIHDGHVADTPFDP